MTTRVIADRYVLAQQIGSGAMGRVWEACDRNLGRSVAIKLMSPTLVASPSARKRFEREATAIAQLQSPHVVQIFDTGIDEGQPYIVMERLVGEDLEGRLSRLERLPLPSLVPLVEQTAKALSAAHARGIVHRDLKPANVFLAQDDEGRESVRVLGFDVVAMLDPEEAEDLRATMDGSIVGTPFFVCPELIRSGDADHRGDLWSLGVLAYRALTGKLPFQGQSIWMLMVRICTDPFEPPSQSTPGLPPSVDAFFEKALAKDPNKRFQTPAAFAAAFAALESVEAPGPAKILVVDDEPHAARLLAMRFRKKIRQAIYHFIFAEDGERALEELRNHPDIDMVLTDINMPNMDGLTLLSQVGSVSPFVRTVVVSAYSDMRNMRTAMNRGAFDFLVKPIEFDDLEATIEKTLREVREQRKIARSNRENSVLRRFASPTVMDRLSAGTAPGSIDEWPGTVAFIGLSGYDVASKSMSPEEQVRTINANFEVLIPAIVQHGGVVHAFFGAAMMAIFRGEGHAIRALDACSSAHAQLGRLAQRAGALSPFGLGVSMGIATGQVTVGEIGSVALERLDCTALGEARVLAVRFQALAGKNQLLVSAATIEAVRGAFSSAPVEGGASLDGLVVLELLGRAAGSRERAAVNWAATTVDASVNGRIYSSNVGFSAIREPTGEHAEGSSG